MIYWPLLTHQNEINMNINIIPIPAYEDNYIWILHNGEYAVVVDPGLAAPVDDYLAKHSLLNFEPYFDHPSSLGSC